MGLSAAMAGLTALAALAAPALLSALAVLEASRDVGEVALTLATLSHDTSPGAWRPGSLDDVTLNPGDTAPPFTLTSAEGKPVSLADHKNQKVIVYVYPAAMTPGCTKQACDFRDNLASFAKEGYAVLGLSPDKPEKLARFAERDALTFPLLSDPDKTVLTAYGAFGEKKLYGKVVVGVIRSTFVIDVDAKGVGTVEVAQYNVKATGHVAKLRRDLGLDG